MTVLNIVGARLTGWSKNLAHFCGSVTTTEVGTDGATTLSRMNLSGYVGNVTIFSSMFTTARCLVVGLGLGLDLVSGW